MTRERLAMLSATVCVAIAMMTGCSSDRTASQPYATVAAESIAPGDPIPAPTADVVVTVTGAIANRNAGDVVELDMRTLEQMGLVEYATHDPWLDQQLEFSGVLLSDLLDTVGADPAATTLRLVALDDYELEIPIADARRWPIMLATRTDGEYMDVAEFGPTRIVFPYDDYPEIDVAMTTNLWIWSVESIDVQ